MHLINKNFLEGNKYFIKIYKYLGLRLLNKTITNFIYFGFKNNSGGKNSDLLAFAGNLIKDGLTENEIYRIYYNLIMNNGTRKTTNDLRNQGIIDDVLNQISRNKIKQELTILDIGSSNGIDAYNTCKKFQEITNVKKYILGDLYTEILYDKKRQSIFDQDGNLLQVLKKKYFVNINFQFTYFYQRITNLRKYVLPCILKKRIRFNDSNLNRIPLIHPVIYHELNKRSELFQVQRLDVRNPLPGRYDIIICLHLLTDLYFNKREIKRYKDNLVSSLNPGGFLITGKISNVEIIFA